MFYKSFNKLFAATFLASSVLMAPNVAAFDEHTDARAELIAAVKSERYIDFYKAYRTALEAGDSFAAFVHIDHAVRLAAKKLPKDHKSMIALRINRMELAHTGMATKQYTWRRDARQIPDLAKGTYGVDSDEYYKAVLAAADLYIFDRDSEKGPRLLKSYLREYEVSANADPIKTAELNVQIAKNYYTIGQGKKAHTYIDTAEEIYTQQLGEQAGYAVATLDFWRAKAYLQTKKRGKAKHHIESALATFEELAPMSAQTITGHALAIQIYEQLGLSEKATHHCRSIAKAEPTTPNSNPMPVYRFQPRYPASAQRSGQEGYAIVELTIDDAGQVQNPRIIDRKGSASFEQAALDAISGFRYVPGFKDGKPTAVEGVQYKFSFRMAR